MKTYKQQIARAFKTARAGFTEAWRNYQQAKQAEAKASKNAYKGSTERLEAAEAAVALEKAAAEWHTHKDDMRHFRDQVQQIDQQYRQAKAQECRIDPTQLDMQVVSLLQLGIAKPVDVCEMLVRYRNNATTLRVLAAAAENMAHDDAWSQEERIQLVKTLHDVDGNEVDAWGHYLNLVNAYSGAEVDGNPDLTISMMERWEERVDNE